MAKGNLFERKPHDNPHHAGKASDRRGRESAQQDIDDYWNPIRYNIEPQLQEGKISIDELDKKQRLFRKKEE
jgi:hypothetical protein